MTKVASVNHAGSVIGKITKELQNCLDQSDISCFHFCFRNPCDGKEKHNFPALCERLVKAAQYNWESHISGDCIPRRVNGKQIMLLACKFRSLAVEEGITVFFGESEEYYVTEYSCDAVNGCQVLGENINIFHKPITS